MGLGKTLQSIVYLRARREEGISRFPDLIVCPASLVYNWKKEIERFAPSLTVCLLVGSAAAREEILHERMRLEQRRMLRLLCGWMPYRELPQISGLPLTIC